jgi:hypothetical protein
MKKGITKLLKIATEPIVVFNKRMNEHIIHFGDINRGEHVVALFDIRLSSQFIKDAPTPEEEPEFRYFVYVGNREIEVTGCLWFELQDIMMKSK